MMKSLKSILIVAAAIAVLPGCSRPNDDEADRRVSATHGGAAGRMTDAGMVDDFSDPGRNSHGIERIFLDDTSSGGGTKTEHKVENGVLSAKGELVPARGQPAWASIALPLEATGLAQDRSEYKGIRLVVRVNQGNLSVSANSSVITNFDYHAATVVIANDGEFHEVKIPFSTMQRAWSPPTRLDTKTLNGISLVAFALQRGSFDFEFDEVSFY